jgi:hypothetical protein
MITYLIIILSFLFGVFFTLAVQKEIEVKRSKKTDTRNYYQRLDMEV